MECKSISRYISMPLYKTERIKLTKAPLTTKNVAKYRARWLNGTPSKIAKPVADQSIAATINGPRMRTRSEAKDMANMTTNATAYGGTVNSWASASLEYILDWLGTGEIWMMQKNLLGGDSETLDDCGQEA